VPSLRPHKDALEEALFKAENNLLRTNGDREQINKSVSAYSFSRMTRRNNGMPTFVTFVPKVTIEMGAISGTQPF
jgi:hypothetical protein